MAPCSFDNALRPAQTRESALAALTKELAMRDKQLAAKDALIMQLTQQQARLRCRYMQPNAKDTLPEISSRRRLYECGRQVALRCSTERGIVLLALIVVQNVSALHGATVGSCLVLDDFDLYKLCHPQAAAASGQLQDPAVRTSATGAFFRSMLRRGVNGALGTADAGSGVGDRAAESASQVRLSKRASAQLSVECRLLRIRSMKLTVPKSVSMLCDMPWSSKAA